jgi:hypothetical protein
MQMTNGFQRPRCTNNLHNLGCILSTTPAVRRTSTENQLQAASDSRLVVSCSGGAAQPEVIDKAGGGRGT